MAAWEAASKRALEEAGSSFQAAATAAERWANERASPAGTAESCSLRNSAYAVGPRGTRFFLIGEADATPAAAFFGGGETGLGGTRAAAAATAEAEAGAEAAKPNCGGAAAAAAGVGTEAAAAAAETAEVDAALPLPLLLPPPKKAWAGLKSCFFFFFFCGGCVGRGRESCGQG